MTTTVSGNSDALPASGVRVVMPSMHDQVKEARAMWLGPHPDMEEVERVYQHAMESFLASNKKRRRDDEVSDSTSTALHLEDWQRLAVEQYCMVLCQSGRADQAKPWLQRLGYKCRLASCVLDYPASKDNNKKDTEAQKNNNSSSSDQDPKACNKAPLTSTIACHVWDGLLSPSELEHLQIAFADPKGDYWVSHNYQVEPPSPYFSYIIPLQRHKSDANSTNCPVTVTVDDKFGCLGSIVTKLHSHLFQQFPKLSGASTVELWAHNRPHPTGHQFHFDSDNEGQGRMIKNPIMTAIVYLSGSGGGPSVVTNQTLVSPHLASKAVLCHASTPGRVVAFEGNLLHGVIPGKGSHMPAVGGSRRVTLMLAYWRRIRVRPSDQPGAARPFPFTTPSSLPSQSWNQLLVRPPPKEKDTTNSGDKKAVERDPMPIDHVYETLDGEPWTKAMGFPEYDQVFQGF